MIIMTQFYHRRAFIPHKRYQSLTPTRAHAGHEFILNPSSAIHFNTAISTALCNANAMPTIVDAPLMGGDFIVKSGWAVRFTSTPLVQSGCEMKKLAEVNAPLIRIHTISSIGMLIPNRMRNHNGFNRSIVRLKWRLIPNRMRNCNRLGGNLTIVSWHQSFG